MKYEKLARFIIKNVGGEKNINIVQHCATRLRFELKDEEKVNKVNLENSSEILQVLFSGGQCQVVIGTHVADVYKAILTTAKISTVKEQSNKNKKLLDKIFALFSGIFTPFVPVMAGAGVLRGLLTIFTSMGILTTESGTYMILYAAADAILYFMPFYLAISASRYFKIDEFIGVTLAGTMLYPTLLTAFSEGAKLSFLGLDVILIKYASSVVPIIVAVYAVSLLDRLIRDRLPSIIRSFVTPLIDLVIMAPLSLLAIGPVVTFLTNIFTDGLLAVYSFNPIIFGFIFCACWQPLVIFGLHRGFIPVNLNNLATTGRDALLAMTMPSAFAQTGAALGIAFKSKNKNFKSVAAANVIPSVLGITEPLIYGTTLKAKKAFFMACLMSGFGGAVVGGAGCYTTGLPAGGILSLPLFAEHGFVWYIAGLLISFIGTLVLVLLFWKDEFIEKNDDVIKETDQLLEVDTEILGAVGTGKVLPVEIVNDSTFSSLALGNGVAIIPDEGKLYAPCDAKIVAVFPTNHAIGLRSILGAEILLHVGIDTVKMEGKGFYAFVKEGDMVKKGQLLLDFNIDEINHAGYDPTIIVIVTNTNHYNKVELLNMNTVVNNDDILRLE